MTLDLDNTEINYLMGRLLAVYEKAELDTYTEEELKSRIPNAETCALPILKLLLKYILKAIHPTAKAVGFLL